jgi:hypothetical protein
MAYWMYKCDSRGRTGRNSGDWTFVFSGKWKTGWQRTTQVVGPLSLEGDYVRTRKEFQGAVKEFGKSNYRYPHISSRADAEGMCTTNVSRDVLKKGIRISWLTPRTIKAPTVFDGISEKGRSGGVAHVLS